MTSTPVLTVIERNPLAVRAAVTALLTALLHLLVEAGVPVSEGLQGAIANAVDVAGALALVLWGASAVTPNAKVISRVTTHGHVVAGEAAVVDTGSPALLTETKGELPVPLVAVKPELVQVPVTIPNGEAG